jgi:hypothetical protein
MDIVVEPGGRYQVPDPVLGFRPIPGRFTVTFDGRDRWQFTNLPETTRITGPGTTYGASGSVHPAVWIFGCSFVQGWGLDDAETLPWKVQELLPGWDVVNFGVGGYGALQSLLQFRRALRERPAPRIVILAYAHFHDERNTRTRAWRCANFSYARFGATAQPYARLDGAGGLRFAHSDESVPLILLRHRSAAFDLVADSYGRVLAVGLRSHEVSERLIQDFAGESRRSGAGFVLAGISRSAITRATLRRFASRGIMTVDISVDLNRPENRIRYDAHPSAIATAAYAEKLVQPLGEFATE